MARKHIKKFDQVKKIILFIWDYRCYICKHQAYDNHVHHLNENPYDNGSHNLIPLCKRCHKQVHKVIKLDHITFPDRQARLLWELDELWKRFS